MINRIGKGRKLIIVDGEINPDTIISYIQQAWKDFTVNKVDIHKLFDYYCGDQNQNQPRSTEGFYEGGINNQTTVNYAASTVRTIVGYTYSQGTQITQRKGKHLKDIEKIIDVFNYENTDTVDHEVGTTASICGMAYLGIFPTNEIYSDFMPDYPIKTIALDPLTTFTVHSPEPGNPTKLSVLFYYSKQTNKTTYYAYTDDSRYVIECDGEGSFNNTAKIIDYDINPIGLNPIILVKNNQFMQGDFELAIQISDAINLLASDSISDVENVIKSLLVIMNAEITTEEAEKARKNRILQLIGQAGVDVDAKFIYQQLDALGIQNLREYFEEAYKQIVGIPDRKTRGGGGGDTGDAVKLRDGWADIEIVARIKEQYFKISKKKQIAVAIEILKALNLVSQDFKLEDIDIKLPRNKNDNIQSKAQSYSTLMSTGTIAPEDGLAMADMTTDISGVVARGKQYSKEKTQKAQEMFGNSNGINNSSKEDEDNKDEGESKNNSQNQSSSNEG